MKTPKLTAKDKHRQKVIRVLRGVQKSILANPEHFSLVSWICSTTACIAGWIVLNDMARKKKKAPKFVPGSFALFKKISVPVGAEEILGIRDSRDLFIWTGWHPKFKVIHPDYPPTPQVTCEYIDFWLENLLPQKLSTIYNSPTSHTPTN